MRLWTIHPRYLDSKGLTALWRESLLARKVLSGKTKGYVNHPQLIRFRNSRDPMACVDYYLTIIFEESLKRGYRFDKGKMGSNPGCEKIKTTRGQLNFEWTHLREKISKRDSAHFNEIKEIASLEPHPLFRIVSGPIEEWERSKP